MKKQTKEILKKVGFHASWIVLGIVLSLLYINFISAESNLGTAKQFDCIDLYQTCNDCSYVNLTSIMYPNKTSFNFNLAMTKTNQNFNYNFCNTSAIGDYTYTVGGDKAGVYSTEVIGFEITYNGSPKPDGFLTTFFLISFLVIIFFLGALFISNLGHFAQLDYDLDDLIKNVSLYFVLVAFYFLHSAYLGYPLIENILVWVMGIAGFTNVGISFLAFIMTHLHKIATQKVYIQEHGE